MKKKLFLLLTGVLFTTQIFAQDCCNTDSGTDMFGFDSVLTFDVGGGYRQDSLQWKTYPLSAPESVIHEKWSNLQIGIVETNAQLLLCEQFLMKFDFDYGWFGNGGHQHVTTRNIDTGVLSQDVEAETSGRVYNVSGAVGYQFNAFCYRFAFTPLVGYAYSFQKLKDKHYHDELAEDPNEFTAKNTYILRWRGPTLGFSTAVQITCNWQMNFTYAYHWIRYRGKVRENFLLGELPGKQKANNVQGNEFTLGSSYEFCPNWLLGLKVNYKNFSTNKGKYDTDTGVIGEETSTIRNLSWDSISAMIDLGYVF